MSSKSPRSQDSLFDAADTSQAVLRDSSRAHREIRMKLIEINHKLDALMDQLGVPYEKPPSGFSKNRIGGG